MSDDQLSLIDEEVLPSLYWCKYHRYAREQSFIEIEVKKTKQKVLRCRYCEEQKQESKKIAAMEWAQHKANLTDFYIRKLLARERKGNYKDEIPQELVDAKREMLQLKNLVIDIQKPLLICKKHGKLYVNDVNRSELRKSGRQSYKCKKCQKELHQRHYQANKALLVLKQKEKRNANPGSRKQERERYRQTEGYRRYRARQERKWVFNLANHYVKKIIAKKSGLIYSEVSNELVDLARAVQMLKREIKFKSTGEQSNEQSNEQ